MLPTTTLALCLLSLTTASESAKGGGEEAVDSHRTVVSEPAGLEAEPIHVSPEALAEAGATSATVLGRLPGLRTTELGGAGSLTRLYVRGADPEQLRVFLDHIPLQRADGGPVDLSEFPLFAAQGLTIWRNHAPIGYGGGIGGALRMTTDPSIAREFKASAEAGAFGTGRFSVQGAYASQDGGWGGRVGLGVLSSQGDFPWMNDGGTALETGDDHWAHRRNNDIQRYRAVATGHLRAGDCEVRLVEHLLVQERGVPGPAQLPSLEARHERTSQIAGASLRCPGPGAGFWSTTFGMRWQEDQSIDTLGEVYHVPSLGKRRAFAPHAAIRGAVPMASWVTLKWSADGTYESFQLRDLASPASDANMQRGSGAAAMGLQIRLPPLHITLHPRVRVDAYGSSGEERAALTWQGTARWTGLQDYGLQLHGGAGSGFRAPTLYELHGDGVLSHPSPGLRDERAESLNLGGRWWIPGLPPAWKLGLEVDSFLVQARDLIHWRRNSLWSATAENVSGASIAGVDGSVHLDILSHVRATWAHTSLFTEIQSEQVAYDGRPLPLRPEAQDTARLTVYGKSPEGSQVALYGEFSRQSSNTVDQAALVVLPPRQVVNAGVRARWMIPGLLSPEGSLVGGISLNDLLDSAPLDLLGYPRPGRRWTVRIGWEEVIF